jgi:hypothetical protein
MPTRGLASKSGCKGDAELVPLIGKA